MLFSTEDTTMKRIPIELGWRNLFSSVNGMGRGSYAIVVILLGLLIATVTLAVFGWSSTTGIDMPLTGYIAMAIGVVFSVLVGVGLMALVFYSSRAGYDEPARLIRTDADETRE